VQARLIQPVAPHQAAHQVRDELAHHHILLYGQCADRLGSITKSFCIQLLLQNGNIF